MNLNPTTRFSNRAENYLKYRPHYPEAIIKYLKTENVLKNDSVIADIGSGTGFSSELFLKNGNTVYGVEPNKEMREAGENYLSEYKNFTSINGTAENTTLDKNSIDIITAGQAYHWFDINKFKKEIKRIAKVNVYTVLFWNIRNLKNAGFSNDYENLLNEFGTDYKQVGHHNISKGNYNEFFEGEFHSDKFDNEQWVDFEGLKGRLLSSSYVPEKNHPNYIPMIEKLKEMFHKHQVSGQLEFNYVTEVYWGRI